MLNQRGLAAAFAHNMALLALLLCCIDSFHSGLLSNRRSSRRAGGFSAHHVALHRCVLCTLQEQGGVKSTPSSPRLRVGVILTDPEPVREAL